MTKCKKHPQYTGTRRPRSGCPDCLAYFEARGVAAAQELAPKKRKATDRVVQTKARTAGKIRGHTMRIEQDPLNGEYVLFLGTRCLYTATDADSLESYMTGFKEGVLYASLPPEL